MDYITYLLTQSFGKGKLKNYTTSAYYVISAFLVLETLLGKMTSARYCEQFLPCGEVLKDTCLFKFDIFDI